MHAYSITSQAQEVEDTTETERLKLKCMLHYLLLLLLLLLLVEEAHNPNEEGQYVFQSLTTK